MNEACLLNTDDPVRARFSEAAPSYHDLATVQEQIATDLIDFLPDILAPTHILDIGCGTGMLTEKIQGHYPTSSIAALDFSDRMLRVAQLRVQDARKIEWIHSDIRQYDTTMRYPLVVSSSCLHWIVPLDCAIEKIGELLEPGGIALIALMLRDTFWELYESRNRVAPEKQPELRFHHFASVMEIVSRLGYEILLQEDRIYSATYNSACDFLRQIHRLGLTSGPVSRSEEPLTWGEIDRLIIDYEANYPGPEGGVLASSHAGFFKIRRPED